MSGALDRFFEHYYRRRPVNATFTGVHAYDHLLPDWSLDGLASLEDEMRSLSAELSVLHPTPATRLPRRFAARDDYGTRLPRPSAAPDDNGESDDVDLIDAELARAFLEIQLAENASGHGVRGNPALWTGEAIFSVIALMIRDFAPLQDRTAAATARLNAIPGFLGAAQSTIGSRAIPVAWTSRALRECEGATILLARGIELWLASGARTPSGATLLRDSASRAIATFGLFAQWLRTRPDAPENAMACGPDMYDLLIKRGHHCKHTRSDLLADARGRFAEARSRFTELACATSGSWAAAQEQLAAHHPAPDDYLAAFSRLWTACHERATSLDVVNWPRWPIRYVTFPEWTRDAAPYLYYLYYRSPAPFDSCDIYDYVVPPLPAANVEDHLRAWNYSTIKLNHVVHHGAIGHHVQNWHAYHRAQSRIGKIAAVDCASRIGIFSGGTMAEGWACYATELMEELGFLTPLERLSEQHSHLRFLARAIVDIQFHEGSLSFDDAVRLYVEQLGMDATVARGEVLRSSMFPGTAIMYWLGTQGILDLREAVQKKRGAAFRLKEFHDELLGFGSIPVPLVARLISEEVA